jgi:hypothetical protein
VNRDSFPSRFTHHLSESSRKVVPKPRPRVLPFHGEDSGGAFDDGLYAAEEADFDGAFVGGVVVVEHADLGGVAVGAGGDGELVAVCERAAGHEQPLAATGFAEQVPAPFLAGVGGALAAFGPGGEGAGVDEQQLGVEIAFELPEPVAGEAHAGDAQERFAAPFHRLAQVDGFVGLLQIAPGKGIEAGGLEAVAFDHFADEIEMLLVREALERGVFVVMERAVAVAIGGGGDALYAGGFEESLRGRRNARRQLAVQDEVGVAGAEQAFDGADDVGPAVAEADLDADAGALDAMGFVAAPDEALAGFFEDFEHPPAGVFPGEAGRDEESVFDEPFAQGGIVRDAEDLGRQFVHAVGVEVQGVVAEHFAEGGEVGANDGAPARRGLDGGHAEAFELRRHHHRQRVAEEVAQLLGGQVGEDLALLAEPAAGDLLAQREPAGQLEAAEDDRNGSPLRPQFLHGVEQQAVVFMAVAVGRVEEIFFGEGGARPVPVAGGVDEFRLRGVVDDGNLRGVDVEFLDERLLAELGDGDERGRGAADFGVDLETADEIGLAEILGEILLLDVVEDGDGGAVVEAGVEVVEGAKVEVKVETVAVDLALIRDVDDFHTGVGAGAAEGIAVGLEDLVDQPQGFEMGEDEVVMVTVELKEGGEQAGKDIPGSAALGSQRKRVDCDSHKAQLDKRQARTREC